MNKALRLLTTAFVLMAVLNVSLVNTAEAKEDCAATIKAACDYAKVCAGMDILNEPGRSTCTDLIKGCKETVAQECAMRNGESVPKAASSTATAPGQGWLTLVPFDCQDANGCDICEVTKVFTNGANIISAVLSAIALLMFIIGGLFLIFSAGNEQRVTRGKQILVGTVTGIAVVFLAWFAVNVIVRTAASSGGSTANQSLQTGTIFSSEWWSLNNCYPDLPSSCKGLQVGAACGGGSLCSSGKTNSAVCSCYRRLDVAGDDNACNATEADASAVASVDSVGDNTKKLCMCVDPCTRYALFSGADYKCIPDSTYNDTKYTKADGIKCGMPNTTCALLKP